MKKSVCIFGGSGFIGSYVADRLLLKGFDVSIFDNKKSPWLNKEKNFTLGDILNYDQVIKAVSEVDYVYNFAGLSDLNEGLDKPIETIKKNILGNAYILEACRLNNIKRFVYASSIYVFSHLGGFYRCSKQSSEQYIEEYGRSYGLKYTILRYGSLYGPRSDSSNGMFRLIKKAIENNKVIYSGDKESTREYIYVEDAAKASVEIIENDDFLNQAVMLTGDQSMRTYDLAMRVSEILNLTYSQDLKNNSEENLIAHYTKTPHSYSPKIGKKFNLSSSINLDDGLLQLIDFVKKTNFVKK